MTEQGMREELGGGGAGGAGDEGHLESGIDVVLVTGGLSGAGRGGTAAKVLEDLAGTSPTTCRLN